MQVVGVVDWEFTYSAPVEFSHSPSYWLLLEQPEYWSDGIEAWAAEYERRLPVFLKILIECENSAIERGRLTEGQRLSTPMRQSWDSGDFWVAYAARKNFAFDAIFWKFLDARFLGSNAAGNDDRWKQRMDSLDEKASTSMEKMVDKKLMEMEVRALAFDLDAPESEHEGEGRHQDFDFENGVNIEN